MYMQFNIYKNRLGQSSNDAPDNAALAVITYPHMYLHVAVNEIMLSFVNVEL